MNDKGEQLIEKCKSGIDSGHSPELVSEGTGGTYFMRDVNGAISAVFKPEDEEPLAPHNPKGYLGKLFQASLRKGILSGEAASREIAAYLLDHGGFSTVPFTIRVECCHPSFCYRSFTSNSTNSGNGCELNQDNLRSDQYWLKVGSLQEYIPHDEYCCDVAPQMFPIQEVHKIGILDIRLLNTDRNDCNMLLKEDTCGVYRLTPVDHGYCLPDSLEVAWCDWVWYSWPQCKQPFSPETLEYIRGIDIENDCKILSEQLSIREASLHNMKISTAVLQRGASAGLNLYEIAGIILRQDLDEPSILENITHKAKNMAKVRVKGILTPSGGKGPVFFANVPNQNGIVSEKRNPRPKKYKKMFWSIFFDELDKVINENKC